MTMHILALLLLWAAVSLAAPAEEGWGWRWQKRAAASSTIPVSSNTTPPPSGITEPAVETAAPPIPTETPGNVTTAGKFQWQFYKSCSSNNKRQIENAFSESLWLSDAINSWVPGEKFQLAFDMYLGSESQYGGNFFGQYNYKKMIGDNIARQANLYKKEAYANANLWVYCNEDSRWWKYCTQGEKGVIVAYEEDATFTNNWYLTFCPAFYMPSEYTATLSDRLNAIKRGRDAGILNNYVGSQAGVWFHEMFHMYKLVTNPKAIDRAYEPKNVYNLAKDQNTEYAYTNADSYHMTALAILGQQKFGLYSPPIPRDLYTGSLSVNETNFTQSLNSTHIDISGSGFLPEGMTNLSDPVNTEFWDVVTPTYTPLSTMAIATASTPLPMASSNLPNTFSIPPEATATSSAAAAPTLHPFLPKPGPPPLPHHIPGLKTLGAPPAAPTNARCPAAPIGDTLDCNDCPVGPTNCAPMGTGGFMASCWCGAPCNMDCSMDSA